MNNQKLMLNQLDKKLAELDALRQIDQPAKGWVKALRSALRMSLGQLGQRLGISAPAVKQIEDRETAGTISLNVLRQAAAALNMKLVYAFIPLEGSLETMIENRAKELAREIVTRTSVSMALEDQENSPERIQRAIADKTAEIIRKLPRNLWD